MKFLRRLWPYALLVLLVAANVVAWSQRQNIADWWRLRGYEPPVEIAVLVHDASMTAYGQKLFYINHPSLEDKESFNQHCSDKGEETVVLGCYRGDRLGIYLYAVTDERLRGVRQVTAAHEMLHQAYDRLSSEERSHINILLQQYYETSLKNDDIRKKVDSYRNHKDADLNNEMHSIFGSEVRDLTPELETYYRKYFSDRQKVVSLSEAYRGEFTHRQELVERYDAQLDTLKAQINANKATLEADLGFLKSKEKEINQDVSNQDQASYEADVRSYNATVNAYNALLTTTRKLIDEYNKIVGERNDIAIQEQQLQKALDSRLDSPPSKQ